MAYQLGERVWASRHSVYEGQERYGYGHVAWARYTNFSVNSPTYYVRFDGDKPPSVPALVIETEEEHLKNVNDRQRLDSSISK